MRTHKIFKEQFAIKWLKQTQTTSIGRNTERKKVSVPYNLLWLRNFFLFLLPWKFVTWTKSCILRQEPHTSSGSLLSSPAGDEVHTTCPPHNTKGFLVQVHHHTERLNTASRFTASLSIWTAFSRYCSPLRTRHSEKHNHAHRAQSAYPRPSAIQKQIPRTILSHHPSQQNGENGIGQALRLSCCFVVRKKDSGSWPEFPTATQ